MDVVVQAAAAPGTGGAWLKLMREGGLDLWTAIVAECITVRCLSEAQLCPSLSLSLAPPSVFIHCLAQYTIHPALFIGKLHNGYNGVRRGLDLVRAKKKSM